MVLAFLLGIIASRVKSDLKFPDSLYQSLTIYLLVAIGMKGGYKLSLASFVDVYQPALVAIALCCAIPAWTYWIMRKAAKMDISNAAALAAHYGSVSAVTFSAALAFHENLGISFEGFMPSMLAMMEIPAILIAILLARINTPARDGEQVPLSTIARELFAGKSSLLLIGFLIIGLVIGKTGWEQVAPLFDVPFKGVLTLFLLEAGLVAGRKLSDLKQGGLFLVAFGIVFPILHAVLGIFLGHLAGLSLGGATILGVLAASASYIAAPAACRVALPDANPSYYITAALAITFPFNIMIGLPLYHHIATLIVHA
ncbi:MAG TPA: sodium-dependent bicarbonate transport family permease [Cyclobacteriaceae bacterium]|nr:sodium-dependent bicarbonate transport family permease [Cyclobacteriaceae bacterium]HQQ96949.1 sodium-dependent bicarbonate transport family permease [Cyclobacteriaceae bacterium]